MISLLVFEIIFMVSITALCIGVAIYDIRQNDIIIAKPIAHKRIKYTTHNIQSVLNIDATSIQFKGD